MDFVFPAPAPPSVAINQSEQRFPVRRIFCVGRNYAAHAREMGKDPDREPPFFFTKPSDALVEDGAHIPYPRQTQDFHFEAELVVAIGLGGINIAEEDALNHVWGYAVGNDLTRRDLQKQAKDAGRPWDWGKAFDRSAVCGPLHPVSAVGHLGGAGISLRLNGEIRQSGTLGEMIWSVPEVISILSASMEIKPGDLIYTGTPAGVGAMVSGDICEVAIDGLGQISTTITAAII